MATKRRHKWEQAISSLLSSRNVKEAATKIGMSYQVLLRWVRHDEEFKAMYAAERKSLLADVKTSLLQSAVSGTKIVQDALDDETETPLARLPAAKFAIESAINLEISEAVLQRIEEPEKAPQQWDWNKNEESEGE